MKGMVKCANEGCPKQVTEETDERFANYPDYCCRECEVQNQKLLAERYKNYIRRNQLRKKAGDMDFPMAIGAW